MFWSPQLVYRDVLTAAGHTFSVPQHILRVDEAGFAGWQLRYGEWTDFPDQGPGQEGGARALQCALAEMTDRIEYKGK